MYKILIVEDELIERTVLKKTLQKKFGEISEILDAENARDALNIFRNTDIQIVILDIEMPGMKGIELAEILRKEKNGFYIIFLTAYDKFEYAKRAVAVHAMEYLLKPYSDREIISVVDEALHMLQMDTNDPEAKSNSLLDGSYSKQENIEMNNKEEYIECEDGSLKRLNVLVSMVEEYLRANYKKDISMQDAAHVVNYSEPYFCKMFKQQYGLSFTAYLMEYRVEEAKKLLRQPAANVKEIGQRVGYPDSTYFARVFRRVTGESPTEYRQRCMRLL